MPIFVPANSDDNFAYNWYRQADSNDLTNEQIDQLFYWNAAQRDVVAKVPNAALSASGENTGRNFPGRVDMAEAVVIRAKYLRIVTASNHDDSSGTSGSSGSSTQEIDYNNISVGPIRAGGGSGTRTTTTERNATIVRLANEDVEDVLKRLDEAYTEIINRYAPTPVSPSTGIKVRVEATDKPNTTWSDLPTNRW